MCYFVPKSRLVIIYLDHSVYHEDLQEDCDAYEDEFSELVFSQGGSNKVVIEELPNKPRKKFSVVIKELPDELLKIAHARPTKKEIRVLIRDLDGKDDTPSKLTVLKSMILKTKANRKLVLSNPQIPSYVNILTVCFLI